MRARTVLIVLLILMVLIAFGPAIVAFGSQEIAEAFDCQVDLNRAIPCVIHGKDYGDTVYNLGFSIWHSYLRSRSAAWLFVIWLVPATIAVLAALRRRGT
jgi:hypothetical protein